MATLYFPKLASSRLLQVINPHRLFYFTTIGIEKATHIKTAMADLPSRLVNKNSPPPPRALTLLARADVLLRTRADINMEIEFGTIAACGVMVYGVIMWKLAQHNARLMLVDEEEGLILVDYTCGRGEIGEREIECRDVEGAGPDGKTGKEVEEEVRMLVAKAVAKIKKWDSEIGRRVAFVVLEVTQ